MSKYRLLRERVQQHSEELKAELRLPQAASDEDLLRVHCPAYVQQVASGNLSEAEQKRIGFPWSAAMAERTRRVSGATAQGLLAAFDHQIAVNLAGGTHHASYNHGAGYCVFNDSVVAARYVQHHLGTRAKRVLVVDLDVHQGNGTAELTANDDSIYTFSMHAAKNYPAIKAISNCDVPLPAGCSDTDYLYALRLHLPRVIQAARADCAIYLAGADPYQEDQLGFLKLSKAGLAERDRYVLQTLKTAGLPTVITMAGGYAPNVTDIVDIHFETVRIAAEMAS